MPRTLSFSAEGFGAFASSENVPFMLFRSRTLRDSSSVFLVLLVTRGVASQGPLCAPQWPGAAMAMPYLCQGLAYFLVTLQLFEQESRNRISSPCWHCLFIPSFIK